MRSTLYHIFRHGSNGANQPMTPRMYVVSVVAFSRKAACQLAEDRGVIVYNNQRLSAKPTSEMRAADWALVFDEDY